MPKMTSRKQIEQHDISTQLYDFEIEDIRNFSESTKGVILSSGIIELWKSESPDHIQWSKIETGIICFIKDYNKKSYFLRLFSLTPHQIWEQEIYIPFTYVKLTKNFHYFAADDCNIGFNFSLEQEAEKFYDAFVNKYNSSRITRKKLKSSKHKSFQLPKEKSSKSSVAFRKNVAAQAIPENYASGFSVQNLPVNPNETIKYGKTKKVKKISKSAIGKPDDFRVIQHVGLDKDKYQFNLSEQDEGSIKIKEILSELNIKCNRRTQAFVEDFISHNGGLEKIEEELNNQKAFESSETSETDQKVPLVQRMSIFKRVSNIPKKANLVPVGNVQPPIKEISMIDHLKSELDKRAEFLNGTTDEEEGEDETSDSEWQ